MTSYVYVVKNIWFPDSQKEFSACDFTIALGKNLCKRLGGPFKITYVLFNDFYKEFLKRLKCYSIEDNISEHLGDYFGKTQCRRKWVVGWGFKSTKSM